MRVEPICLWFILIFAVRNEEADEQLGGSEIRRLQEAATQRSSWQRRDGVYFAAIVPWCK